MHSMVDLIDLGRTLKATVRALLAMPGRRRQRFCVPDRLPSFVNAGRAFVTIGANELFWMLTAWPNGAFVITFAAIVVILFAPKADQAPAIAMSFTIGTVLAALFAAIVKSAALPGLETLRPSAWSSPYTWSRPVP
jgi:uncharacterized membrane protein YccC